MLDPLLMSSILITSKIGYIEDFTETGSFFLATCKSVPNYISG